MRDAPISKQKKPTHTYKTIDCIFNHQSLYGNVDIDNRVPVTSFNLKNSRLWKPLDPKAISALHYSR